MQKYKKKSYCKFVLHLPYLHLIPSLVPPYRRSWFVFSSSFLRPFFVLSSSFLRLLFICPCGSHRLSFVFCSSFVRLLFVFCSSFLRLFFVFCLSARAARTSKFLRKTPTNLSLLFTRRSLDFV